MEDMQYCPVHKTYHRKCNNPNHNHSNLHHHEHKNHFHIRKNSLSKTYIIIFLLSIVILILITVISFILLITNVNYPRIFFPVIIIYVSTFICGGGIIGSYGPINNQELNYIYMRKCASIVMLIICLICFPFFFFQNLNFFISVKSSKEFCLENEQKSKGDFYLELIEQKEKINSLRNNYNNKLKNGLTCFEEQKCVKSILDSDSFICNYNYAEKMKENINCKRIYETEHILNNIEDSNVANFVSSCLELINDNIKLGKELFKCSSYINLCKDDSYNNEEEFKEIESYYNKKDNKFKNDLLELEKKLKQINVGNYSYENMCLANFSYNIIIFSTGLHILLNCFISITWIILGIISILKNLGFIEDTEKKAFKEMWEKTSKIFEEMHPQKVSQNTSEENIPLNIGKK